MNTFRKTYYPLGLSSKVKCPDFGSMPSKKYTKYKCQKFTNKYKRQRKWDMSPTKELNELFEQMYLALKDFTSGYYQTNEGNPCKPNLVKALNNIIPIEYFGSALNRKKVFFVIKRILTQTRGEFIHMDTLYKDYDYKSFPWINLKTGALTSVQNTIEAQILNANIILLQTVVKPLIRYFYYHLNSFRTREMLIVQNGKMHSFTDRNTQTYLKKCYLVKVEKDPLRDLKVNGALRFIPKKSLACLEARPILMKYRNNNNKLILDSVKENLKKLICKYQIVQEKCLYQKWKTMCENNRKRKLLFAVKLDLVDAFGRVDVNVIKKIIKEDMEFLSDPQKKYVFRILNEQFVHIQGSKHIYQWNHGLLQGTNLSPILCDLYLSYLAYKNLRHFIKPNTLFHRTADDLFFVSTCDSDIYEFELAVVRLCLLNESKTVKFTNIEGEDPHIVYCGKVFNITTREISNWYEFKKNTELRSRFKFWNPKHPIPMNEPFNFIKNVMKFAYVNFCFSKFELNTTFNSPETVLRNIYDGFCYVAFKLDCVVESISYAFSSLENRCNTVEKCIHYILVTYCSTILKMTEKYKGEKHDNVFLFDTLFFIGQRAMLVVLGKRFLKYSLVIAKLKVKTKRFVKLFDVKYFLKLPDKFSNIKMQRMQKFG